MSAFDDDWREARQRSKEDSIATSRLDKEFHIFIEQMRPIARMFDGNGGSPIIVRLAILEDTTQRIELSLHENAERAEQLRNQTRASNRAAILALLIAIVGQAIAWYLRAAP